MNTTLALLIGGIVITSFLMGRASTKIGNMKADGRQSIDLR